MINFVLPFDKKPEKSDRSLFNLLNIFGKVKEHSVDAIPQEKFVYEYVQNWNDPVPVYFGTDDVMKKHPLPENVRRRVKDKTAFLIFTMATESPFEEHNLRILHNYFTNLDLPCENIVYFSCSPNMNMLYKKWCENKNIKPSFTLQHSPYYAINTCRYTKDDSREYSIESKEKTFLSFNRRWSAQLHRVYLLYFLTKHGMLSDSYVSFSKKEIDSGNSFTQQMHLLKRFLPNLSVDNNIIEQVESILPLNLDFPHQSEELMYKTSDATINFYFDSFVNITTETYFFSDIIHITEKTFKPIRYKQPFIIMGAPGFLQAIRNMGFKTFSSVWDESYDLETDHERRIYKISNLLLHLYSLSSNEKIEMMKKIKEIVDYNYKLVRHLSMYFLKDVLVYYKS